jgi:polysaccharide pyruvyl transferase WcaK-like protein
MNFLITNSVPLNGGDEALLRAAIESLTLRFPGSNITTLCKDVELARKHLPDLKLESDLEFAESGDIDGIVQLYREADVVLSAPGGFLHDFYSIEDRLQGFEVALALGKPVILLGQSLGPFWKPESLERIPQVLNLVAGVCVRDAASKQHLLNAGVRSEKIRETGDMAFLWRRLAPELFQTRTGNIRTIGVCFRAWPLNNANAEQEIIVKAEQLCRFLLDDGNRELIFLSTCQGVPGYVDDSALATQIVSRLPREIQSRCRINRARLSSRALIEAFGECDAFIGMRLHGCILSMLGGTPAMGLGYETKTREIFGQLGLDAFQIPFESEVNTWLSCARRFLDSAGEIREKLSGILDQACRRAELNVEVVDEVAQSLQKKSKPAESQTAELNAIPLLTRKPIASSNVPCEKIARFIPQDARFILVDDMHWAGELPEWRTIPFLEKNGEYWGPPADSAVAIGELERLRNAGAEFIVFAEPSFWWLQLYRGFHSYLRDNYRCVLEDDELTVFNILKNSKNA